MTISSGNSDVGRRVQKVEDKRARIFEAASTLFAENSYGQVTTQQVSDRAGIAAGTLFRYAASKGELLLMVYNERFRHALELAGRRSGAERDAGAAALTIMRTILDVATDNAENTVAYQRELLFGSPTDTYRAQGLAMIAQLESMIADRLAAEARAHGAAPPDLERRAQLAGRSAFAVLNLTLAQPATGAHAGADAVKDVCAQVLQIVAGFRAELGYHLTSGEERQA
ncbi:TetR/AcrR family transcriptional regulator [Nocardia yamanashiensis]|uniref:TetR/AcrR family transcriptional regulator n=1 Tax=Nocardia yamanashiensis TaxID=209247 RepID=UPI001E2A2ADD|nr:TetR/AcrR family transcriptional regulator [Nocardia yamanashiensis]UGT41461.1 TetR/AcrR family transcriptional regulator [Nocardia yamanashiensis]